MTISLYGYKIKNIKIDLSERGFDEDGQQRNRRNVGRIGAGDDDMPVSEAQLRAKARYSKKTYDTVLVSIRKDSDLTLAMIKEYASAHGESTNGFIVRTIREAVKRTKD